MVKRREEEFAVVIIYLLMAADLLSGLFFNLGLSYYRIGLPLKCAVVLIFFIRHLTLVKQKTYASIYIVIFILSVVWFVGSFISYLNNSEFSYVYSAIVLNRYFYFLFLSLLFLNFSNSASFTDSSKKAIVWFFLVNNTLIFCGLIFNIDLFSTYDPRGEFEIQRFGYKGLMFGGNDLAAIYILGVAFFFREKFKCKEPQNFMIVFTSISALLTGTKATLFGVLLISFYYLFKYRLMFFFLFFTPLLMSVGIYVKTNWTQLNEKYFSVLIRHFESNDLLTFLMTGRNEFISRNLSYMQDQWSIVNFFTGDAFLYSETDFFDLYFFFGLGSILYFIVYIKIFFIRDKSYDNLFVFMVLMGIAFMGGHIIQSAAVPLFLLLLVFSYSAKQNEESGYNRINQF